MSTEARLELLSQLIGLHTTMVGAAERLNQEICLQMALTNKSWSKQAKRDWGMLVKNSTAMKYWHDLWLKDAQPALKLEGKDDENPIEVFDSLLADSNTLALVEMLVYNATYGHNENMSKIIQFLLNLTTDESPMSEDVLKKFNFIEEYDRQ